MPMEVPHVLRPTHPGLLECMGQRTRFDRTLPQSTYNKHPKIILETFMIHFQTLQSNYNTRPNYLPHNLKHIA